MRKFHARSAVSRGRRVEWILVSLALMTASIGILVGCSTESRIKIKNVIFTGIPPAQEEEATEEAEQAQAVQSPVEDQASRQERFRDALVSRYWQHRPYAEGECGSCHNLGQSMSFGENRNSTSGASGAPSSVSSRLLLPKRELCISCHTEHGAQFARDSGLKQHLPSAAGFCTSCHNPHQSLRKFMLLKADNNELCGGCHNPVTMSAVHAENPPQDCISCHNAHVGTTKKLLKSNGQELTLLDGGGGE